MLSQGRDNEDLCDEWEWEKDILANLERVLGSTESNELFLLIAQLIPGQESAELQPANSADSSLLPCMALRLLSSLTLPLRKKLMRNKGRRNKNLQLSP